MLKMFIVKQLKSALQKLMVYGWSMDTDPEMKEDEFCELKIDVLKDRWLCNSTRWKCFGFCPETFGLCPIQGALRLEIGRSILTTKSNELATRIEFYAYVCLVDRQLLLGVFFGERNGRKLIGLEQSLCFYDGRQLWYLLLQITFLCFV